MIPGIVTPTGNLGGLSTHQVIVTPIAAEALAKGDLVRFDLSGTVNSTYTDYTKLLDSDEKKCPFNVVIKNPTTAAKAGVYGVALEAATAGSRAKICLCGLVEATVFATASNITALGALLAPDTGGAGRLTQHATGAVCLAQWLGVVATPLTAVGSITASSSSNSYVLFNGFVLGTSAA